MRRTIALLGVIGLITGALIASPAAAKGKCRKASGENGPVTVVTDKATEGKPIVTTIEVAPGGGGVTAVEASYPHGYLDIQIDSTRSERGLWVRLSSAPPHDYDLYLRENGQVIADSNGWNPGYLLPVYGDYFSESDNGGRTDLESETLTGIRSGDCTLYTIDAANALGTGGELQVEIWLGDIKF